jgi:KDO2-lipid IV(A) lauroyltransferase
LRFTYKNPEVIHALYARKKSILLTFGHVGNWEWLNNLPLHFPYKILAMYKPLKNRHVDRMFIRMRERFGLETIPMATSLRAIMDHERNGVLTLTLVLIDQRPPIHQVEYWLPFLHQDTPVLLGTEKISKKLDFAVVFMHIRKTARNCYEGEFVEITETPAETAPREITEATFRELEKNIREQPWSWLWSHKRWKFDRAGIAAWQTENKKNPSDKK